jgi:hypothetical protein
MTDSSKQVKVAARDLMSAIGAWLGELGAEIAYAFAYLWFIIGRNYAALTKMKHADMVKRFPKPQSPSAKAGKVEPATTEPPPPAEKPKPIEKEKSQPKPAPMKSEQSVTKTAAKPDPKTREQPKPAEMKPESSSSKASATKEPAAVPKPVPKKPPVVKTAESVVPPNLERAVAAQLKASTKDSLTLDEMQSFMTALGVGPAEAKSTLQLLKTQTKRDTVSAGDLPQIQAWITKTWILAKRRQYKHFEIEVREQFGLELNAPLMQDILTAELLKRGFSEPAAGDIATKLITRDWI